MCVHFYSFFLTKKAITHGLQIVLTVIEFYNQLYFNFVDFFISKIVIFSFKILPETITVDMIL